MTESAPLSDAAVTIPEYLTTTYDWAYVTPRAVNLFERQWLVNLILWGNFSHLRDLALASLGTNLEGRTLQIACVYGDLTPKLFAQHAPDGKLDVLDVLPIQLSNLTRKLNSWDIAPAKVGMHLGDSSAMRFADASYDRALLFFLLHEQPEAVRQKTLAEAIRVVKPGGKLVIVDYHRPSAWHPLWLPMRAILGTLEPFALDLWQRPLADWFPENFKPAAMSHTTYFGGLYQLIEITI